MIDIDKVKIGSYCRHFREVELNINLTNFCVEMDENIKNVSAFENGRANNIKYLFLYKNMSNSKQQETFLRGLFNIL